MGTCTCTVRQGTMGGKCLDCGGDVVYDAVEEPPPLPPGLEKTADWLRDMGPVQEPHRLKDPMTRIVDDSTTMKCACDKVVDVMGMPRRNSGVVQFVDNVCAGCEEQAKGLSPVICTTCHRVCGRLKPFKDKHGFEVEAGRAYHTLECPLCQPGKFRAGQVKSPIIEMLLYHRKVGVKD